MRAQRNVATRRSLLSLTAALAAAGLAGCGSVPQAEAPRQAASARPALSENADGSVEHIPSGMKFPALVGSFIRGRPRAYDAQGMNVSAGYDGPQAVTITVYVYPIEAYGDAQSFSAKHISRTLETKSQPCGGACESSPNRKCPRPDAR